MDFGAHGSTWIAGLLGRSDFFVSWLLPDVGGKIHPLLAFTLMGVDVRPVQIMVV